jgi:hypothetical protein
MCRFYTLGLLTLLFLLALRVPHPRFVEGGEVESSPKCRIPFWLWERARVLTLPFSCSPSAVQPATTTIQPPISTIQCFLLNKSILICYFLPCTPSPSTGRQLLLVPLPLCETSVRIVTGTWVPGVPTYRRSDLNPLECAFADKHRVLSVFSRTRLPSSSLEATLTRMLISVHSTGLTEQPTPLDATFTENTWRGLANSPPLRDSVPCGSPVPLRRKAFGATICKGTGFFAIRGNNSAPPGV